MKKITEKQAKEKNLGLLGEAFGDSLEHCMREGRLHCENFEKRVKYYTIKFEIEDKQGKTKLPTLQNKLMIIKFWEGKC